MNERKTENLVRKYLSKAKAKHAKNTDQHVWIEEQKSDKPNIDKLLKSASKSGDGTGYPEFIITFENSDLLIVIECKADAKKHRSKRRNKYKDYAVDGALLYSSYLSKQFDVIAIGVSGENKQELQVDTTQATNNGVRDFYDIYTEKGKILTIDSAVVGFCAYQPFSFSASDHVEKLLPNFEMNIYRGLFIATVINKEQYRYSYGRKFNQDRIRATSIKLPFQCGGVDWDFIENYMKSLRYSKAI